MTRIDTPLAQATPEKSVDKIVGKTSQKDGDGRQAAFRSLLHQLGGHAGTTTGDAGKEAKAVPDDVRHGPSPIRHRTASKEDKTADLTPDAIAVEMSAESITAGGEPVLGWQAILGGGEQQASVTLDLTALVAPRTPAADVAAMPSGKSPLAANGPGRLPSVTLPSNKGLDLALADPSNPTATEGPDPFAALSSLLDRATDATAVEPEPLDLAPLKMSIVTRETHFEPVARLSPVQQIATAIGDDLATFADPISGGIAAQPSEPTRHSAGPLKVLHVKLEPEDLGAVVLKMRLVDKSLELEVVASRQETADLLAKDRDMLTRVLRGSGYAADVVTITTSTSPDGGQMSGDSRSGNQTPSGQAGAQAGGNRDSNNAAGGGDRPASRPQPMEGAIHEESGAGRSGGDLYL